MKTKKYVVSRIRDGQQTYLNDPEKVTIKWTEDIFQATMMTFNKAASVYFDWSDKIHDGEFGVKRVEVDIQDVEIEVSNKEDE